MTTLLVALSMAMMTAYSTRTRERDCFVRPSGLRKIVMGGLLGLRTSSIFRGVPPKDVHRGVIGKKPVPGKVVRGDIPKQNWTLTSPVRKSSSPPFILPKTVAGLLCDLRLLKSWRLSFQKARTSAGVTSN